MVWPFRPSSYYSTIRDKRAERDRALAAVSDRELSSIENVIVGSTAQDIVQSIQSRKWTAVQVVHAFIKSAVRAQALTNAITEVMFEDALLEAEDLDKEFSQTKQIRGPLHGLPISLKDQYNVTGYDSTIGFTQWAWKPATSDANIVMLIREAGGIPLFKTNVPQTMLSFESINPLWGRTVNPYSAAHSCGGSSGGEGAAIAMNASALGWGSDVGGSLRIPAHYCGIYSMKPGVGRLSGAGAKGATPGFEAIVAVIGPMGRSVQDLELACRVSFGKGGKHQFQAPLPYRKVELPTKLKFGYYTSDNFAKASPACKRAVLETVDALRSLGHECVEFDIPSPITPMEIFTKLASADAYRTLLSHLGPDPVEPYLFLATLGPRLYGWARGIVTWLLSKVAGDDIFARMISASHEKTLTEYYRVVHERDLYNVEFYDKVWNHHGFDSIIAPVQAIPAIPNDRCKGLLMLANATILYNVVDSPVGTIPVTRVDPTLDGLTDEWTKRGEGKGQGSYLVERDMYGTSTPAYDVNAMKGLPVGVQIVGKKWEDEKVIEIMKLVDEALGSSKRFGPSREQNWSR